MKMRIVLDLTIIAIVLVLNVSGQGSWVDDLSGRLTTQGLSEDLPDKSVIGTLNHIVGGQSRVPKYYTNSTVFSVDADTGVVTLTGVLNYAASPFFVYFTARIDDIQYENTQRVSVKVIPVNHNPEFDASTYTTSVREDAAVGSRIFDQITAKDRDTGPNGTITVTCLSNINSEAATACQWFSVNIQPISVGEYRVSVNLTRALDYNNKNSYSLHIQASDGGQPALTDTANVTINVENARDTRPVFLSTPIIITVPELAPTTTNLPSIQARRRSTSDTPLAIKIISDPLRYFNLEPVTSQGDVYSAKIRTTGIINTKDIPEQSNLYYFTVAAVELFNNGQESQVSSETTVTVQITDVNNNPPTFSPRQYSANVTEGMPFQATVPALTLFVQDLDTDDNAYFVLEAVSDRSPSDTFGIVPNSGIGSVSASLIVLRPDQLVYDDPNKRRHTVTITARENRTQERLSGTATVVLTVQNPNNQPTPFLQSVYPVTVVDNRNVNDVIITVSASDVGTSSGIRYAITAGNDAQLFKLDPVSGLLSIAKTLNAATNPQVTLTVSATNRFGLVSYATVPITIRDSRSQGPVFKNEPYITTANENETELIPRIVILATPLKADKVVRYRIISGNPDNLFRLNQSTTNPLAVDLTMTKGVDYNDTPNRQGYYLLVIEAADDVVDPLFTNTTVVINIRDRNNHAPTFLENATYSTSVKEIEKPGTFLLQVNASDLDAGENSRLSYILGFGSKDNFAIDYTTGQFRVAPVADLSIDKYGDMYNITVYAVDHGSPQLTGTVTIYVKVNASIYRPPVFDQQSYIFTISESSAVNFDVGNISARALDAGANLIYTLDPESAIAEDANGQPVTETNATFNFKNYFKIDPTTGGIKVAQALNRQYVAKVQFDALANITNPDRPTPEARVKVTIYIVPKNPSTQPTISFYTPALVDNKINVSIFETNVIGAQVTQFGAVYGTGNNFQPVTDYRIGNTNDANRLLTINNETGALTVAKPIVYESLPGPKVLTYEIIARSPSPSNLSATATIQITVRSIDEGKPEFSTGVYNFSVREDASLGQMIGQVKATLKVPGAIQYRLTGAPMDFNINADTGEITVKNPLDAETRLRYLLTASTVDKSGQGQIQSVTAQVIINVIDVNEFGPRYTGEPYNAPVYDTVAPGTTLVQVAAIDPDVSNTKVTYEITGGNEKGLFSIDRDTGEIKTTRNLTGESQPNPYQITVTARDSGTPSLSTNTVINILVRNQTVEGNPTFLTPPRDGLNFSVYEGRLDAQILDAYAVSNRQAYPNITYGLYDILSNLETNKKFNFNSSTGVLTTAVRLNRTEQNFYTLVLQAFDSGSPALTARTSVNVLVYSDAPPTFTSCPGNFSYPEVEAYTLEKQPTGQFVIRVKACSYDINPKIYYYISSGNGSYLDDPTKGPPFAIGKETGIITTNEILYWYNSPILYLNVTATTDSFSYNSALNIPGSTIRVKVIVNGTNGNGPTFNPNPDLKEFCRGIGTKKKVGILDITGYNASVIQFYAGDCDSPENRNNRYSLSNIQFIPPYKPNELQSTPTSFAINDTTGWVFTRETSYRKFTDGKFRMTVSVTDGTHPPATSELTVYIIRESQRLRYVFSKDPRDIESSVPNFVGDINTELDKFNSSNPADDVDMVSDILRLHVDKNAELDFEKSDLCFHVVQQDGDVLNVNEVKDLYNRIPSNTRTSIYSKYYVDGNGTDMPQPCYNHVTTRWWSRKWFLWWLLIALALFIWVVALILIICVCVYWPISRRNYFKSRPYVVLDEPPVGTTSEFEWQHSIHRVD